MQTNNLFGNASKQNDSATGIVARAREVLASAYTPKELASMPDHVAVSNFEKVVLARDGAYARSVHLLG